MAERTGRTDGGRDLTPSVPDIAYETPMPSNIDAERVILGALVKDNEVFFDDTLDLQAEDFYLGSNRKIFMCINDILFGLVEGIRHVDEMTLAEVLRSRQWLEEVGGVAYICGLSEGIYRNIHIEEHIRILKDKARLRKVIATCSNAIAKAEGQSDPALKIVGELENSLMEINADGPEHSTPIGQIDVESGIKEKRSISNERVALDMTWGVKGLDDFTHGVFKGEFTVCGGEESAGKLMDVEELIPTPNGFKRNGDLCDGDEIFGEDGRVYKVVKAHPIQEEEAFLVRFDDNTETFVHEGHLWYTWTLKDRQKKFKQSEKFRSDRRSKRKRRGDGSHPWTTKMNEDRGKYYVPKPIRGSVKTTKEISETLMAHGGECANHSIPLAHPLELPYRNLPLDPYVLGAWLGDGTSSKPEITIGSQDEIEMCSLLAGHGEPVRKLPVAGKFTFSPGKGKGYGEFKEKLRGMGVLNNKHIPEEYLWSSCYQRLELLRGMMDTDGYCNASGAVEFTNTNREVAMGVYRLASSLGVKPHWNEGIATLYGKVCGPKYRVTWTAPLGCFYLRRKLRRLPKKQPEWTKYRRIVAVEPIGKRKMRCITTSNPSGLYLFGANCNVTHNSSFLLQMLVANAMEGTPCGLFSLEMSKDQVKRRCYPLLSEILTSSMIRDPRLINSHTHVPEMERITQEMANLPIYIDDTRDLRIDKLISRMRMMRRKFGVKLFGLDFLQLVKVMPKMQGQEAFIDTVIKLRDFPAMIEPDCHLIALSQYSNQDNFVKGKKRGTSSYYGGSVIRYAAQNLLMISVEDQEKRDPMDLLDAEFRVAKQRDGKRGKVSCFWDRDHYKFTYPIQPLRGM